VEGILVGQRTSVDSRLLELQSGVRSFVAELKGAPDEAVSIPIGSRLELTGVFVAPGGNRTAGQEFAAFELLLASPASIRILARPPWWTLKRLLYIVSFLGLVLAAALLWITLLRRQVEERTAELGAQIQQRQKMEQQQALERERSRVAQDLHDDLGAGLTEISILGKQARAVTTHTDRRDWCLNEMDVKARQMVDALDEIVWAMSPTQDSLASLVSYFCLYADRFLGLANIVWQLEEDRHLPDLPLNSLTRHEVFLAYKEALTNIVRHSGASEVTLSIKVAADQIHLSISDNGRGMVATAETSHAAGLDNMNSRMQKLGGRLEVSSEPGRGTTLHFWIPAHN